MNLGSHQDTLRGPMTTARQTYDHRLRLAIAKTGDAHLFRDVAIPASTRRSWTTRAMPNVVALHDEDRLVVDLHIALAQARHANAKLRAIIRLLLALVAALGGRLKDRRVPAAHHKRRLLAAVHRASPALGRTPALRVLGLTPARVRDWERRSLACTLEDAPSCPKHSPQQLTREERGTIRRYAEELALRHLSTVSLALLAARNGHLFAAASTWLREMHRLGIERPRKRLHPRRSKVGVRASRPNELWHIDASRVRLLDGTVRWLHGVIDNHSRKILAWTIGTSCRAAATETLLRQAVAHLPAGSALITVITDDGSENTAVNHADFAGLLRQVRAQVDVTFSNSMIESFWNQLKHRWLFLHHLDSEETLVRLTGMYVDDHNALIPRAALGGRTPDEVYNEIEPDLPDRIATEAIVARQQRLLSNKARAGCGGCDGPVLPAPRGEVLDNL